MYTSSEILLVEQKLCVNSAVTENILKTVLKWRYVFFTISGKKLKMQKTFLEENLMKKYKKMFVLACVAMFFTLNPMVAPAAESDAELIKQLQRIFEKRPDLIINVLRKHSEIVLDVAQDGSTQKRLRSLEAQWEQDMKIPKKVDLSGRPSLGPDNAPITVVEFSDFTCPYCAQGALNLEKIMANYGNKIRLVFKHTPLSENPIAIMASEYVIAAGFQSEEKSWKLYHAFFGERTKLLEKGEAFMKEKAKEVGLNVQKLMSDAKSKKTQDILKKDLEDAKALNIEGTPYFLVNNLVVRGALPMELFKRAFDMALEN